MAHPDRFEAWADPADNWTVWDIEQDAAAVIGTVPLIGLGKGLATALCQLMNAGDARLTDMASNVGLQADYDNQEADDPSSLLAD